MPKFIYFWWVIITSQKFQNSGKTLLPCMTWVPCAMHAHNPTWRLIIRFLLLLLLLGAVSASMAVWNMRTRLSVFLLLFLYSLDAAIVDFESWSSVSRWAALGEGAGDDDEGGGAATSLSLVAETHVVSWLHESGMRPHVRRRCSDRDKNAHRRRMVCRIK